MYLLCVVITHHVLCMFQYLDRLHAASMHARFASALTAAWFDPSNASTLRDHLRVMILEQYCAQGDNPELLEEARHEIEQYRASTTR